MKYTIEKISNSNFFEFGDFINPYDKKAEDINTNTTKSYFDLANIEILGEDNKARLNLFDAKSSNLDISQSIYAYPVSQSWTMGQGHSYDNPITEEGCSWNFRHGLTDGTLWSSAVSASGGTWYSGSGYEASHSINHKTVDIRMNVTDIVNQWISGSISNDGFMIKRSGSIGNLDSNVEEGNTKLFGDLSFFSSDTHTKYPPTLETVWDDSSWNSGSLSPLTMANLEDMTIYMKGLRPEYKESSRVKFRLVGRERFPEASYSTTPANLSVKYLPSGSSFYSILDAETEEVIVPYGSGSKISCDSTGNFFNIQMDGFQSERNYRFCVKVVSGSGTTETINYYDDDYEFRVVR